MDALEDILRSVRGEVGYQLSVDRQVRSQYEEVLDLFGSIQISDEGTHEPCFANTGSQSEAEGWKVSLKVLNGRKLGLDCRKLLGQVGVLVEVDKFTASPQATMPRPLPFEPLELPYLVP